mmetsp:Transcript_5067/g.17010  ORF Transcript_5067/g.17010 Transcript_5067/m.17010 type:complete len:210 (+) Transcript_5067:161-790(+)
MMTRARAALLMFACFCRAISARAAKMTARKPPPAKASANAADAPVEALTPRLTTPMPMVLCDSASNMNVSAVPAMATVALNKLNPKAWKSVKPATRKMLKSPISCGSSCASTAIAVRQPAGTPRRANAAAMATPSVKLCTASAIRLSHPVGATCAKLVPITAVRVDLDLDDDFDARRRGARPRPTPLALIDFVSFPSSPLVARTTHSTM